jgi:ABC-type transport system substrate-binding protein
MQPRMVSFLGNEHDLLWRMPEEFANRVVPNNHIAPDLGKRGIQFAQQPLLDLTYMYFYMKDPIVGGYTPDKVALRRAITLAYKTQDEINVVRKGQAILAETPYSPGVAGYDPNFRTGANEYNPAKANALLDMYGYKRGSDGYRTMPDGTPLVLKSNSTPTDRDRQLDEMWRRSMEDIGIRIEFRKARWPDLLKESNAGKLMMWQLGGSASAPDAETWLTSLYGKNVGEKSNRAWFQLPAFDELYEKAILLPDSPERTRLYQQMAKLVVAYAPWRMNLHRIGTDLWYPYVLGFRRPLINTENWWRYVDIDLELQKKYLAEK